MNPPVPTPRQFLTSLIDSLASTPTPPTTTSAGAGNPLNLIPPAYRPLLTTLYALYPLTLLPALDLLDRRLASRVVVGAPLQQAAGVGTWPGQRGGDVATASRSPIYVVRSAQPSRASPGLSYVVRLEAWSCTCAAFAFAAFPREDRGACSYVIDSSTPQARPTHEGDDGAPRDVEWQFGALSLDGTEGSGIAGVPCCKHLLACVLAERWSGLLDGYVDERVVTREEGAGLVADI
ncbi:hypothetical protein F4804DRAFT_40842 [Jackrogersella minutella]|nr:hypothetical protein F4804DRAFT_40842 [Jackrogersella minutella]